MIVERTLSLERLLCSFVKRDGRLLFLHLLTQKQKHRQACLDCCLPTKYNQFGKSEWFYGNSPFLLVNTIQNESSSILPQKLVVLSNMHVTQKVGCLDDFEYVVG